VRSSTLRAPTYAGIGVVLVAAAVIAAIALIDPATDGRASAAPEPTATPPALEGPHAVVALTSNMYARPSRTSDIVAIVPEGRTVRVTGRTDDALWLRVVYPLTSTLEGWIALTNVVAASAPDLAALPEVATAGAPDGGAGGGLVEEETLPDLTVSSAEVQPNGMLVVRITNIGRATFASTVGVHVSTFDGEIVGVLEVDLTNQPLAPGRSASVNTGVLVTRTGLFVIEVDRANEVEEASEFNNIRRVLLVGTGG
jgi:hypothetical protein